MSLPELLCYMHTFYKLPDIREFTWSDDYKKLRSEQLVDNRDLERIWKIFSRQPVAKGLLKHTFGACGTAVPFSQNSSGVIRHQLVLAKCWVIEEHPYVLQQRDLNLPLSTQTFGLRSSRAFQWGIHFNLKLSVKVTKNFVRFFGLLKVISKIFHLLPDEASSESTCCL